MSVRAFGARCIVKEDKLSEETKTGIIIPGRDKFPTNKGLVINIGKGAVLESGQLVPMEVAVGDTVIYASFAGSPINFEGETYIILNERDILCAIND